MRCLLLIFIALISVSSAYAEVVQILHINDTHSYFAYALKNADRGGYARLKAMIDDYKEEAKQKNIETIVVHAGDFIEGNLFYMADGGRQSWKIHNLMGYDISVIGNRDYMGGLGNLNKLLEDGAPTFAFLGANFNIPSDYKYINKYIHPDHKMNIGKTRIGFLGLTSDNDFYKWQVPKSEYIRNPSQTARKYLLKMKDLDVVIALTHLGLNENKRLIKENSGIGLVIGGNGFQALRGPVFGSDKKGKKVPIIQAGYSGEFLGRLLVKIEKNKTSNILDYQLLPIASTRSDSSIDAIVSAFCEKLNESDGGRFLWETVGYSLLSPLSREAHIRWSYFVTESIREVVDTQIALHSPDVIGTSYPSAGSITRYDLYGGHPGFIQWDNNIMGSPVYKVVIRGMWIDLFLRHFFKSGVSVTAVGLQVKLEKGDDGITKMSDITIKGKKIDHDEYYTVALPGVIVESLSKMLGDEMAFVFTRKNESGTFVVQAIEEKIRRHGGVLAYEDIESIHHKIPDKAYIPNDY